MKLLKFNNYQDYRDVQVEANKLKFSNIFAEEAELQEISRHHLMVSTNPRIGVCHGVRNGFEVQYLRSRLGSAILGTDISDTAANVPHCIVWDMHDVKPEWQGNLDFIYSNSWDHTYDPDLLFKNWISCLSESGRLYVTWTRKHSDEGVTTDSRFDAFGCSLDELLGILRKFGEVEDVLVTQGSSLKKTFRRRLAALLRGSLSAAVRPIRPHRMITVVVRRSQKGGQDGA